MHFTSTHSFILTGDHFRVADVIKNIAPSCLQLLRLAPIAHLLGTETSLNLSFSTWQMCENHFPPSKTQAMSSTWLDTPCNSPASLPTFHPGCCFACCSNSGKRSFSQPSQSTFKKASSDFTWSFSKVLKLVVTTVAHCSGSCNAQSQMWAFMV